MKQINLVVLIPAFNEEKTIGSVIQAIPKNVFGITKVSILVLDDGSTDKTVFVAKKNKAEKIVSLKQNQGLGIAFRRGVSEALKMKADILVNIDADNQFDARDIPKLIAPILEEKADMVTCSRFLDKTLEPKMPWIKKFGNKIFTSTVNFLTNQKYTDTQCGFRAYSRETCLRLNIFGKHTYTQEVFIAMAENGLRIKEIACKVKGEREGKSKVVDNVFFYGLKSLLIIVRTIRDYKPLAFFGSIGIGIISLGVAIAAALFIRWLLSEQTSPFTSLIPISGIIIILGFLLLILAFLADMSGRQRKIQEEILYILKRLELK